MSRPKPTPNGPWPMTNSNNRLEGNSRQIISSQKEMHNHLEKTVQKHLHSSFQRPVPAHARHAIEMILSVQENGGSRLILDSGCGTGQSTKNLAKRFPDHFIIGVDKSLNRLNRERHKGSIENMLLLRSDLTDLYPLLASHNIQFSRHFIFYPNPWPKPAHLQRRWHGSPVFPALISIADQLELRTNWQIYANEFAAALLLAGKSAKCSEFIPDSPISPFEKKYQASGHQLWRIISAR